MSQQPRRAQADATTCSRATGHGVCATCHNADDKADKGAAAAVAMRGDIERLKTGIERTGALIGQLKNAGIEVSDQQLALREAGTKLTLARTEMHAFAPPQVAPVVADGDTIIAAVDKAGQNGVVELRYPTPRALHLARRDSLRRRRAWPEAAADRTHRTAELRTQN